MFGAFYFGQPYFGQGPNLVIEVQVAPNEIINIDGIIRTHVAADVQVRRTVSTSAHLRRRIDIDVER